MTWPQEFQLGSPMWLHAGWGALLVGALAMVAVLRARSRLRRSVDASVWHDAFGTRPPRWWRRHAGVVLSVAGLLGVGAGLARPQSDPRPRAVPDLGRDVVLLVDVSRSMLAEDMAPNRLERSKLWARDLVDALPGTRIGVVAFAGDSVVLSPLTRDHAFTRAAIAQLGTESVNRGGSLMGDAIRATLRDVFALDLDDGANVVADRPDGTRDLIVITDGDDQESFPIEAAAVAGQHGVRVLTLGVGSTGQGALVPTGAGADEYVRFEDRLVRSSLNPDTLARMAAATPGGRYLQVGVGDIDLAGVYTDLTGTARGRSGAHDEIIAVTYAEHFLWPLVLGLVCLFAGALIDD